MIFLDIKNYPIPQTDAIAGHGDNAQLDTNSLQMDGFSPPCHPEQFYHLKLAFEIWNLGRITTFSVAWTFFFILQRAILNTPQTCVGVPIGHI